MQVSEHMFWIQFYLISNWDTEIILILFFNLTLITYLIKWTGAFKSNQFAIWRSCTRNYLSFPLAMFTSTCVGRHTFPSDCTNLEKLFPRDFVEGNVEKSFQARHFWRELFNAKPPKWFIRMARKHLWYARWLIATVREQNKGKQDTLDRSLWKWDIREVRIVGWPSMGVACQYQERVLTLSK